MVKPLYGITPINLDQIIRGHTSDNQGQSASFMTAPTKNVVLDFQLEILSVFIKFDSQGQPIVPIEHPDDDAIARWIDDKLVGFTETFFELYFHDQYQRGHLAFDPVMCIRFPRAFALGTIECDENTYHLYTNEPFSRNSACVHQSMSGLQPRFHSRAWSAMRSAR